MEILDLKPRRGSNTYRIGDSDDLVVIENVVTVPLGEVRLQEHGIMIICTEGRVQFEYDSTLIQMKKNDMFLYMAHSVACNFMASPDFNCRQIWFNRSELWNTNLYSKITMSDMSHFKLHPLVHLSDDDVALLNNYFQLLCYRMKDSSTQLKIHIVRSLVGTMLLEGLAILRRNNGLESDSVQEETNPSFHKRNLVDKFMNMVEQSDGRIRRVDDYANQLNVTPKYLSTVLKEVMNRRPSVYIQLFTMKAIECRLRFTDMTMQEIANDLKFPNASFFGKYFKEHSGMTPVEYRIKYQNGK